MTDAEQCVELDLRLFEDGRGMVSGPDQVRSFDEERSKIEAQLSEADASVYLVAEAEDGRIIGSAQVRQFKQSLLRHVGSLALGVDPEYQNYGVGRALIKALIERVDSSELLRIELYVRADNERAIHLYESLGFHHEGRRVGFVRLSDGSFVDDLIMARLRNSSA